LVFIEKIVHMDAHFFIRHQFELVLRNQMWVSNYFVNSFYSVKYCIRGAENLLKDNVMFIVYILLIIYTWISVKNKYSHSRNSYTCSSYFVLTIVCTVHICTYLQSYVHLIHRHCNPHTSWQ